MKDAIAVTKREIAALEQSATGALHLAEGRRAGRGRTAAYPVGALAVARAVFDPEAFGWVLMRPAGCARDFTHARRSEAPRLTSWKRYRMFLR
jgi:hypothetical protein